MSRSEQWEHLIRELNQRQTFAESMGGDERVARQHARGRLTARERIDALFDTATFSEIGALAGSCHPAGDPPLAGDGLVGGTGKVLDRTVVAMAEDFTVKGGSIGHANAAKRNRLVRIAAQQRLPLVIILDGAGERASNSAERYPNTPNDLQLVCDLKGQVPVVTMVMGVSAGHGALTGMFADFIVMLEGAALFTAGPPLVQASLGISTTPEELGSANMHATESGVVHNVARTEQQAFAQVRHFLSLMPQRAGEQAPQSRGDANAMAREVPELLQIIPPAGNEGYDMRKVLHAIADENSVFEMQPGFGGSIVVALAKVGGIPAMIVASQPLVMAGAITRQAAEKATHFIEVASSFGLPLITLLDNPGVLPGPQSERTGVLKAAGKMFYAQRKYVGKKIVVTLRKAFGFGSSVMGMNPWDNQAISIALPTVSLGGVPALGGAVAAKASESEAAHMQEVQSGAWVPADAMAFDKVIHPGNLRNEIIEVLHRN